MIRLLLWPAKSRRQPLIAESLEREPFSLKEALPSCQHVGTHINYIPQSAAYLHLESDLATLGTAVSMSNAARKG